MVLPSVQYLSDQSLLPNAPLFAFWDSVGTEQFVAECSSAAVCLVHEAACGLFSASEMYVTLLVLSARPGASL